MTVEHEELEHGIVLRIEQDPDVRPPQEDMDFLGKITYRGDSRYVLGTEPVDADRFEEISRGVASGELVGIPVWAYVHSGSTIRAAYENPFHCPWDSGRSGWAYCTRERAIEQCGSVETALECLKSEVKIFDQYLTGDVYGYVIEDADGQTLDSCWGCYGLDYCREAAREQAQYFVGQAAQS